MSHCALATRKPVLFRFIKFILRENSRKVTASVRYFTSRKYLMYLSMLLCNIHFRSLSVTTK